MSQDGRSEVSRRHVVVGGLGLAATAMAAAGAGGRSDRASSAHDDEPSTKLSDRLPVLFAPHGGGPWPFVELGFPAQELASLRGYLESLRELSRPKALLVISAHWEERVATVQTHAAPPLLFDYYGFPDEAYRLTWPAPGHPQLAARVRELLAQSGLESGDDAQRGFDHGTFVPMKVAFPDASIPTVQLSLKAGLDPSEHLSIGRALAPLREEGVLIVASGLTFHNLRAFRDPRAPALGAQFDEWLRKIVVSEPASRDEALRTWTNAPAARFAHPREEHLLPLMVAAGAAGNDRATVTYRGTIFGVPNAGFQFG